MWVLASMKLVKLAGGLQRKQELGLRFIVFFFFKFLFFLLTLCVGMCM